MPSTSATDVTEFYRQLAMLTRSDLPLPESIQQLAGAMGDRRFKDVLERLGRDTAAGQGLADAMRAHPDLFQPFHVQLIATGERSGVLPDVLNEVAGFAQRNRELVRRTREALAYPLFTVWFAAVVWLVMLGIIVPGLERIVIEEWPAGERLNWSSRLIFSLSHLVVAAPWAWGVMMMLVGAVLLWLFSSSWTAQQAFQRFIVVLPGAGRIVRHADYARLCSMLGLYVRHQVPMAEACDLTAGILETASLRARVHGWAGAMRDGVTPAAAIAADPGADGLLRLCFTHAAENDLAADLSELGEIYEERALAVRHAVVLWWTSSAVIFMAATVGAVIIAIYLPLIMVMSSLGMEI